MASALADSFFDTSDASLSAQPTLPISLDTVSESLLTKLAANPACTVCGHVSMQASAKHFKASPPTRFKCLYTLEEGESNGVAVLRKQWKTFKAHKTYFTQREHITVYRN